MSEFFKQLIGQLSAIWRKLTLQQKVITTAVVAFAALGLITLLFISKTPSTDSGMKVAYRNIEMEEAGEITQKLQESGFKYKLDDNGSTILVDGKKLYEVRMVLAREGLPKRKGVGYELFDVTNFSMTDFTQKLNARRALEGELRRTIEDLEEVEAARIHIVIPEPSIFLENQKDPKASVVIKVRSGRKLSKEQVRGISHLVSSSIDGLEPDGISIVDFEGRLLSTPYGDDPTALACSRNMELQQNVEKYLERKAEEMLLGVLGPGKATVQMAIDLDFDLVEKSLEKFDPESRVIRSEERTDENIKNAPDGDRQKEHSTTNYEIDKTIEKIVQETGNIKRQTVSVAIDGRYKKSGKSSKDQWEYEPRTAEEMVKLEDLVKKAIGYSLARGDEVAISNVQFDNEFLRREQEDMTSNRNWERYMIMAKYAIILIIAILLIFFLRYIAKTVADAMNPPVPEIQSLVPADESTVEVPEHVRKSNEILEKVELMTREEPLNISSIIKTWLSDVQVTKQQKSK
jgi:flagellar M-ring protein FliF